MRYATRKAVKHMFGRKRHLPSKVVPHYPESVECEYVRVVNGCMKQFHAVLLVHLPKLRVLLESGGVRTDATDDEQQLAPPKRTGAKAAVSGTEVEVAFAEILNDFEKRQGIFKLQNRIEKLTNLACKLAISECKRVVKRTLCIDIPDDY
jgi:hypothetical protein